MVYRPRIRMPKARPGAPLYASLRNHRLVVDHFSRGTDCFYLDPKSFCRFEIDKSDVEDMAHFKRVPVKRNFIRFKGNDLTIAFIGIRFIPPRMVLKSLPFLAEKEIKRIIIQLLSGQRNNEVVARS
jgi:hypothetical protein